ncbi:MAG: PD-(D/E)XK nuclease family protein, partial [Alphaproteobacteria bacterium]|nr:PD-(D/E)XK nuclease family protein [Alphaproteobacteria bacterium]
ELDPGDARDGGQVRIMTVHAAKGLEAPIVFLPDTAAVPRSNDMPKFQWSAAQDDGGAPLFLTRKPMGGAAARIWRAAHERQLEEYRRLFYVALTRAENRLYICGWKTRNGGEGSWYDLAATALRVLHEEHAPDENGPAPDIVLADPVLAAPAAETEKTENAPPAPLPAWALLPVARAPQPEYAPPPSSGDEDSAATPDAAFARGRIIHRLLQSLPDIAPDKREAAAARFLAQPRHDLTDAQRDEIARETMALLDNELFAPLFAPGSRAEAALTGSIGGAEIFRQVDRLCLRGEEVWVVDYKTNRPPPEDESGVPDAYRAQLGEYRALLSGIYPGKRVRCFLLWTYAPRLMEITV